MTSKTNPLIISKWIAIIAFIALGFENHSAIAEDWGQWMGPNRDGVYNESGVIDAIPETGLEIKWRTPIKGGYAGPAVADGKVFVFDYLSEGGKAFNRPDQRANLTGKERIIALNESDGKEIWSHQ